MQDWKCLSYFQNIKAYLLIVLCGHSKNQSKEIVFPKKKNTQNKTNLDSHSCKFVWSIFAHAEVYFLIFVFNGYYISCITCLFYDYLRCDSIDKLKQRCSTLEQEIRDPNNFKDFYQFTFNYAKNPEQKGLGKSFTQFLWDKKNNGIYTNKII